MNTFKFLNTSFKLISLSFHDDKVNVVSDLKTVVGGAQNHVVASDVLNKICQHFKEISNDNSDLDVDLIICSCVNDLDYLNNFIEDHFKNQKEFVNRTDHKIITVFNIDHDETDTYLVVQYIN